MDQTLDHLVGDGKTEGCNPLPLSRVTDVRGGTYGPRSVTEITSNWQPAGEHSANS